MAITEEILRLRYEAVGKGEVANAQGELARLSARLDALKQQFEAGAISAERYNRALQAAGRVAATHQGTLGRWDGIGGGGGRGGGTGFHGLRETRIRAAFTAANLVQDFEAAGMRGILNNLVQPQMWQDFAAAIGSGGAALSAFGGVMAVTAAGLIVLDDSLKDAGLGWSDLNEVVGELAPIKAAGEALGTISTSAFNLGQSLESLSGGAVQAPEDLGDALRGLASTMSSGVTDLASWAIGWDQATEAVKKHKTEVEATAKVAKLTEDLGKRYKSTEQVAQAKTGALFAAAMAESGGVGGIDALGRRLDVTNRRSAEEQQFDVAESMRLAAEGNVPAMERVMKLAGRSGLDVSGLEMAARGVDVKEEKKKADDLNEQGREFEAEFWADQRKVAADDERLRKQLNQQGVEFENQFWADQEKVAEADERLRKQLNEQGQQNQNAFFAEQQKAEEKAAQERPVVERALLRSQLGLMADAMGLGTPLMEGPKSMGGADFARQIEASQRNPMEKMFEAAERQIEIQERMENHLALLQRLTELS